MSVATAIVNENRGVAERFIPSQSALISEPLIHADPQSIHPGCAATSPARDPSSSDVSTMADLPGGPFAERRREDGMERTSVNVDDASPCIVAKAYVEKLAFARRAPSTKAPGPKTGGFVRTGDVEGARTLDLRRDRAAL